MNSPVRRTSRASGACRRTRSIVRCDSAKLQRSQIHTLSNEVVGDVWQTHPTIDGSRPRRETEIEVVFVVDVLEDRDVLPIETRHIHESVVVDEDAVSVLIRRLHVLGQGRELARLQRPERRPDPGGRRGRAPVENSNRTRCPHPSAG